MPALVGQVLGPAQAAPALAGLANGWAPALKTAIGLEGEDQSHYLRKIAEGGGEGGEFYVGTAAFQHSQGVAMAKEVFGGTNVEWSLNREISDFFLYAATAEPEFAEFFLSAHETYEDLRLGLGAEVDVQLAGSALEFGEFYVDVAAIVVPVIGMADATYDFSQGRIGLWEYTASILPTSRINRLATRVLPPQVINTSRFSNAFDTPRLSGYGNQAGLVPRAAAERGVPQVTLNAAKGRAFEEAGIRGILSHVGLGKNTTAVTRNGVTTILDSAGRPAGLVEFKDVANLSSSPQLRAQLAEALATRQPYNLVVSPGNQTISKPLLRQIEAVNRQVGGGIYRYDPATDILTSW